jgi:hypothetical protein
MKLVTLSCCAVLLLLPGHWQFSTAKQAQPGRSKCKKDQEQSVTVISHREVTDGPGGSGQLRGVGDTAD